MYANKPSFVAVIVVVCVHLACQGILRGGAKEKKPLPRTMPDKNE